MNKKIIVGLHLFDHDGNLSTYDLDTKEFKYIQFERISGIKYEAHFNLVDWIPYLHQLGYKNDDVNIICITKVWMMIYPEINLQPSFLFKNLEIPPLLIDHHLAHHFSTEGKNTVVMDGVGSEFDILTIFKEDQQVFKQYTTRNLDSLGKILHDCWLDFGFCNKSNSDSTKQDFAGHAMALYAFGKDYSYLLTEKDNSIETFKKLTPNKKEYQNDYIHSLHIFWYKILKNILQKYFNKDEEIKISGGVGHNIILNTLLKKDFPNLCPTPHCNDGGISTGALSFILKRIHNIDLNKNNFYQQDENFGYASLTTIQKTAEYLKKGKIVMWGQGWGEIGPRALGHRSILMDPCVPNAKEIINDKIKKRIWFRPYGASVLEGSYKNYFDLDFTSPWMLFQANVKDPLKFKNITHADGTCRIQTVNSNNASYFKLLKEFQKLSGYPVLMNTSMNLPGKPIVGTKKQAKIMFDNSQADVLIIGNEVYKK